MGSFTSEETHRYRRHFVLEHVGAAGQSRLQSASLVAEDELEALYLAAAGVGTIVVPTEEIAQSARALNPLVRVEVGNVRRFVNIFVKDEDIRFLQNLETPLGDKDEVSIVPAIAGG